jgi:hypothetical protein
MFFAIALGVWTVYSTSRLSALLIAKRRRALPMEDSAKEGVSYWLGAIGSSVLAVLAWMLVVSQIRTF